MICITYKDTIRLIKPVVDGYGAESIGEMSNVPSLFAQNTGWSHGSNQSAITSDAVVYVDPTLASGRFGVMVLYPEEYSVWTAVVYHRV